MNKEHIRKSFDKAARQYDDYANFQKNVAEKLAKKLSELPSPRSICEIGCGTGFLTQQLHQLHPNANYLAVDLSPKMIETCRTKIGASPKMNYLIADAENLQLTENFDWIVSSLAMQWMENFSEAMQCWWEKTNILAFATLSEGTFQEWHAALAKIGVTQQAFKFPNTQKISDACDALNPSKMQITEENHRHFFTDALDFARSLKNIGAAAANEKYHPVNLRRAAKILPQGIEIGYRVVYCILKK